MLCFYPLSFAFATSSAYAVSSSSNIFAADNTTDLPSLWVTTPPSYVRPYMLANLDGLELQLADDVFRVLVSSNASGGAFTLLGTNGQTGIQVNPHNHRNFYENFFSFKGRINLWVNNEQRQLTAHDFGAVPPSQNHSYQIIDPDAQLTGFIQPGGFEDFFVNISTPYSSASGAPYPPDQPLDFPINKFLSAAPYFDVNLEPTANLSYGMVNGTSPGAVWRTGNNTLPGNSSTPYFLASNYGPKYLHRALGQVIAPRSTANETDGNFTISTIVMRKKLSNETIAEQTFDVHQTFQVLEGQLSIGMAGFEEKMSTGDVVFIPAGTPFTYWSDVKYTKFFVGTAGEGLDYKLIQGAEPWDYAVFPAYL